MSYGIYNEVYFAVRLDKEGEGWFKIGETSNARRRSNQLYYNEGYCVTESYNLFGDEANRLFVESYLRVKIELTGKVQRVGKDYFLCKSKENRDEFKKFFSSWVKEAEEILKKMQKPLDN